MKHTEWCTRTAQDHASCYRLLGSVTIGPDAAVVVELHKARDVPAVITLTRVQDGWRYLIPLNVDAADLLTGILDQGVTLIVRSNAAQVSGRPGGTL